MQSQVRTIFGDYDIFAKLIPGTVFSVGVLSFLPRLPELESVDGGVALVSIVVVIILTFGFIIGQGLHSFAVSIEYQLYRIGKGVYAWVPQLRQEWWKKHTPRIQSREEEPSSIKWGRRLMFPVLLPIHLFMRIYTWSINQIYGLLIPHRLWFKRKLSSQLSGKNEPDPLYNWFKLTCRDHLRNYDLELPERHEDVYRFVMSYLEYIGNGRARKFQATCSFCRSMWVTLLTYSIIYSYVLLFGSEPILGYEPIIERILSSYGPLIPSALLLATLLFMSSSKQYKRHFAEYIVVDFYNIIEMDGTE